MTGNEAFGQYLDDPDELFRWVHQVVMGVATINLVNRAGVTTRLLEFVELFRDSGFAIERVSRNPQGHSVVKAVPL